MYRESHPIEHNLESVFHLRHDFHKTSPRRDLRQVTGGSADGHYPMLGEKVLGKHVVGMGGFGKGSLETTGLS